LGPYSKYSRRETHLTQVLATLLTTDSIRHKWADPLSTAIANRKDLLIRHLHLNKAN
jgi:hypothetical protein